jgi:hypothetical protein
VRRSSVAAFLLCAALLSPACAQAAFGVDEFTVAARNQDGTPATQAGGHPYAFEAHFGLDTEAGAERLRNLYLRLPPGFLVNPGVVDECASTFAACPNSSQVGVVSVEVGSTVSRFRVFNLAPGFGAPAAIGFSLSGTPVVLTARLREEDSGLDLALAGLAQSLDLRAMDLTLWGAPWDASHDLERGGPALGTVPAPPSTIKSYLTLPTTPCGTPPSFTAAADSWQGAAATATATIPALQKCNKALTTARLQLSTDVAAARTGLTFSLDLNDGGGILNPAGIARPAIKTAIATLPDGLTINPSLGAGLGVCTDAEFARETATSEPGAGCPNQSKIGAVALDGVLGLAEPLLGSVYLAKPYENPFGSLLAVQMLARSPRRGLIVKSRGRIEPDPGSGRLVATFDELPRLLYTHFGLSLREGQRSALISPAVCGTYATDLQVSSWTEPDVFKSNSSSFPVNRGEGGGPCPSGVPPFAPGLVAGSINPQAAARTPFYLRMTRRDAEQEITSYSASLPPGLLAKIAGVTTCPDAAIAAARGRTGIHGGAEELGHPSCPASSLIGRTEAGYGVGEVLAWAPGGLYLAGPYNGAPLSTVAIDSATIGPFDLGVVVVRSAIRIDPRTAQVAIDSAGSDPIPHLLRGIPLHLRDIRVLVDRPDFMRNPTSCDRMAVRSTLTGAGADLFGDGDDSSAGSSQRFQVLNCSLLGFRPRLALRLRGRTRHGGYPSLRAAYTARPGDANLAAVSVSLPPTLFLAQEHIDAVCTRAQFAADRCPAGSIYGRARALTPLLDEAMEGPVYLRSSRTAVPDLVARLRGRGIEIEVPGRIDSSRGGIRVNFESLPDAPVTRFTMALWGGKHGLLQNGEDLCRARPRANARFVAQSNETAIGHPRLAVRCGRGKGVRK